MAITVVHTSTKVGFTSGSSFAITSTTAGNCIVVCVLCEMGGSGAASVSGVTLGGAAGNFASACSVGDSGNNTFAAIWADPNCTGGQTTITISGSNLNAGSHADAIVYEVSGLVSSSVVDKTSTNSNSTPGNSFTSNATATTTVANEIWIGACSMNVAPTGPGAPWNNTIIDTIVIAGTDIVSSTGAATYSGTMSSGAYSCGVATLKGVATPIYPTSIFANQAVKRTALY